LNEKFEGQDRAVTSRKTRPNNTSSLTLRSTNVTAKRLLITLATDELILIPFNVPTATKGVI